MNNKNILLSNKNKEILWNVLYNNKFFNEIDEKYKNNIISIIDNCIENFYNNLKTDEINIIEANKLIIKEIIVDILKLKKNPIIHDIEIAKGDFDSFVLKKPEEINFTDEVKDETMDDKDINDILNKMINERENDEKKIFGNNIIDISNINKNTDMKRSSIIEDISGIINLYDSSNNNLFVNNEYNVEKKFNVNSKIDYMIQLIKNMNKTQEKILEKLEKLEK